MKLIWYPKCSTCVAAKKYLEEQGLEFTLRDIVLEKLNKEEIDELVKLSKKDINKFFNTSGLKYRKLNLKDKIKDLSYQEKLEILASDGMLIKRPILVLENNVLNGFKINEWDTYLQKNG